jgi:hypothetical protein
MMTMTTIDPGEWFRQIDQMHMIHDFEEFTGGTPTETQRLVELFFRQQIEAIRIGMGARDPGQVPRFVI